MLGGNTQPPFKHVLLYTDIRIIYGDDIPACVVYGSSLYLRNNMANLSSAEPI